MRIFALASALQNFKIIATKYMNIFSCGQEIAPSVLCRDI